MRVANDSVVMSLAWRPLSHMILREPSVSWSIQHILVTRSACRSFLCCDESSASMKDHSCCSLSHRASITPSDSSGMVSLHYVGKPTAPLP